MVDDTNAGTDGVDDGAGGNPFAAGVRIVEPSDLGSSEGNATGADNGSGSDAGITDAPKRRGRKPGSKNAGTKAQSKADISGLEKILFSVHLALAAATHTPELALDADEARELAKAAAEVQSHYEMVIDPKVLAWGQLIMVAGSLYTPRILAASIRIKREAKEKRGNVVQGNFNHAPTG